MNNKISKMSKKVSKTALINFLLNAPEYVDIELLLKFIASNTVNKKEKVNE